MSETNSAVLELKDDEDESDSVLTSKTVDGAEVEAPLIMEDGYDIAVKVDNPLKQLSTLETFVTYRVRCVCARWPSPPYVRRRYNHFKVFHKRISSAHPLLAIPPLPPHHSALEQLDRYEQNFVAVRTLALNAFMDRIAKHPILTHSEELRLFVTTGESQADRDFRNESFMWGLPGFSARESRAAGTQRVKDPEFTGALDYLNSLQQKLSTLNSLTNKLHKGTNGVGLEMAGLSSACSSWVSAPQSACAARAAGRAARVAASRRSLSAPAHELPFLAAYASAIADKITQRNYIHATHVSGNTSEDVHNRLLQASEALRSDLADWTPKTRTDIKKTLLNMAEKQINIHQQTFQAWEQALKEATAKTPEELFKTVSKTAVQNLSPTKHRIEQTDNPTERDIKIEETDNHTEKDIEDFEFDSEIQEISLNEDGLQKNCEALKSSNILDLQRDSCAGSTQVEIHNYNDNSAPVNSDVDLTVNDGVKSVNDGSESTNDASAVNDVFQSVNDGAQSLHYVTKNYNHKSNLSSDILISNSNMVTEIERNSEGETKTLNNLFEKQFFDINSDISENLSGGVTNLDSVSKEQSAKIEFKGVNTTSDPLSDFTEIDLNNT